MKVLFIEPFYSGSHRYFADGYVKRSNEDIDLIALPGRFWKWRHSGSALWFAENIASIDKNRWDALICCSMTDLAHLKALRPDLPPVLLYVHENQFAYPVSENEDPDYRYGITDMASMLAADALVFNSDWNRQSFLSEAESLFKRLPDAVPTSLLPLIREKSEVISPGVAIKRIHQISAQIRLESHEAEVPLVIWNHRHEHDKNPPLAFEVLKKISDQGIKFHLALLGERFKKAPPAFNKARIELSDHIVVDKFPDREEYIHWLCRGDIVISTANHEFFGIAIVEAIAAGCFPLLPHRLSYPEVLPEQYHRDSLWRNEEDLREKLTRAIKYPELIRLERNDKSQAMARYDWEEISRKLDEVLKRMVSQPDRQKSLRRT